MGVIGVPVPNSGEGSHIEYARVRGRIIAIVARTVTTRCWWREKVEGFSVCGSGLLHRRPYNNNVAAIQMGENLRRTLIFLSEDYDGIMVREKLKVTLTVKLNVGWYLYSDQPVISNQFV